MSHALVNRILVASSSNCGGGRSPEIREAGRWIDGSRVRGPPPVYLGLGRRKLGENREEQGRMTNFIFLRGSMTNLGLGGFT
jgi:hypothetical protein